MEAISESIMLEILIAEKIYKTYNNSFIDRVHSEKRNEVLKGVDLTVGEGECIGIMGKSGCGKTTLLKILGTIEKASKGKILFQGEDIERLSDELLSELRRKTLGFVFQDYKLLNSLTVKENIIIPMVLEKKNKTYIDKKISEEVELLGISSILNKYPYEISGGEKQRVAIARALANDPMANDGSVWDFRYLIEQVIKNNMSMIFPMCIALIAGYIISREEKDDVLKNIITIPISFKKLLVGKLIVCAMLSILFGLICTIFTLIAECIVGFPGFTVNLVIQGLVQITLENLFLYLAVLPIIVITSRLSGGFMIGVIVAFVYGYGGMFAAGNMTLANIYPITASLGLIGYRSYDTSVQWSFPLCLCSLIIIVAISVILVATMKEKENKKTRTKTKKVKPKKGWL